MCLSPREMWYGRPDPPPEVRVLRAGPLTVSLVGSDLWTLSYHGCELMQRLYMVVRDVNWDTIAPLIDALRLEQADDRFRVSFEARNQRGDVDFRWRGTIVGSSDGTIEYAMDGRAYSSFRYNKVHLCVHHPVAGTAGRPFRAETPAGVIEGRLPTLVGAQHLDGNGIAIPLFPAFSALSIQAAETVSVRFRFEGDLWEMEDHRNWTDASFKTYGTPESLGIQQMDAGQRIRHTVLITVSGRPADAVTRRSPIEVTIGEETGPWRLKVGLGMATHARPLTSREAGLLRSLKPDHVRVDVAFTEAEWAERLDRGLHAAGDVGTAMELALHLGEGADAPLAEMRDRLSESRTPVARVLVFGESSDVTPDGMVSRVREVLAPVIRGALYVGGSDVYFAELNRADPRTLADADAVVYAVSPQVHASDELSVITNLDGLAETVRAARVQFEGKPVVIGSATLRPRSNSDAVEALLEPGPGELPSSVDARQASLFAGVWTVGCLKAFAESGALSVTLFETTGWRGILECEDTAYRTAPFPSLPGGTFPVFHVLADVLRHTADTLLGCESSRATSARALAWRRGGGGTAALVANLTWSPQPVRIGPLEVGPYRIRRLNADVWPQATLDPVSFRARADSVDMDGRSVTLTLEPFEIVHLWS